jgi:hypothetical protein
MKTTAFWLEFGSAYSSMARIGALAARVSARP